LKKSLEIDKNYPQSRILLASIYYDKNDYVEAIK